MITPMQLFHLMTIGFYGQHAKSKEEYLIPLKKMRNGTSKEVSLSTPSHAVRKKCVLK